MLLGLLLFLSGLLLPAAAHLWLIRGADLVTAQEVAVHSSIQHVATLLAAVIGFDLWVAAWCRRIGIAQAEAGTPR